MVKIGGLETKMLFRKLKLNFLNVLLLGIILCIAISFFVILQTILVQYERTATAYYDSNNLAAAEVYAYGVEDEDVKAFAGIPGVLHAEKRMVEDGKTPENHILRLIVTENHSKINTAHIYSKPNIYPKAPLQSEDDYMDRGCLLSEKYARAHNIRVGDSVKFKVFERDYQVAVSGIFASPEYVYLAQSQLVPMANSSEFGFLQMDSDFADEILPLKYNRVVMSFENQRTIIPKEEIKEIAKSTLGDRFIGVSMMDEGISYESYVGDLGQIRSFVVLFPTIFFMISALIIYVLLRRDIDKERRQIGIKKAMGVSDKSIIRGYLFYVFIVLLAATLLSYVFACALGNMILEIFKGMFEVPELRFAVVPEVWIQGFLIAFVVCIPAAYISFLSGKIFAISPAEAMGDGGSSPSKVKISKKRPGASFQGFSLNTRYALKAALRSKGRFLAMVIGMSMSVALAVFSLGFHDGLNYMISDYYAHTVKHDMMIQVVPRPVSTDSEIFHFPETEDYAVAQLSSVTLSYGLQDWELPLLAVEDSFNMVELKDGSGRPLDFNKDGIIIPAYIGGKIGVKKGDFVHIKTEDDKYDFTTEITGLSNQNTGFYGYMTFNNISKYIKKDMDYNTVFLRTSQVEALEDRLKDKPLVMEISTTEKSKNSLNEIMETSSVLISILITFAVSLGLISTMSVSMISLMIRRYEFAVLKVLGYMTPQIMKAFLKETALQAIIAYPLGCVLGRFILISTKDEFSSKAFSLPVYISPMAYVLAFVLLFVVIFVVSVYVLRYIRKIDLVEAMKSKE